MANMIEITKSFINQKEENSILAKSQILTKKMSRALSSFALNKRMKTRQFILINLVNRYADVNEILVNVE